MTCLEVINMIASIATSIALIFVVWAIYLNTKAVKLQRQNFQAVLFHNITNEINSILGEEKELKEGKYENWLDRLIAAFEYYAFYVNRGYLTESMAEYYMPSVEFYCKKAKEFSGLISEIEDMQKQEVYCEIKTYYKKFIKKECPF